MPRSKTLTATVIASLALVVGLSACGGSSDSSEKTTTTVSKGTEGSTTTSSDDETSTTEEEASTTVVATGGGDFCDDLASYINENAASDVDSTDPAAYKEAIETSTKQGKKLLSNAPDDLQDSVEVILDAQDELVAELEKVDYDFTKLPADALSVMDTPEIEAAGKKLDAYVTDTCGIDIPKTTVATAETIPEMTVPAN